MKKPPVRYRLEDVFTPKSIFDYLLAARPSRKPSFRIEEDTATGLYRLRPLPPPR